MSLLPPCSVTIILVLVLFFSSVPAAWGERSALPDFILVSFPRSADHKRMGHREKYYFWGGDQQYVECEKQQQQPHQQFEDKHEQVRCSNTVVPVGTAGNNVKTCLKKLQMTSADTNQRSTFQSN